MASVRPSEVQAWVSRRNGRRSPATVQVIHGILASIFKAASATAGLRLAVRGDEAAEEAAQRDRASGDRGDRRIGGRDPERYQALVVLGAGTGMRQGECFGLILDRIDFLRRPFAWTASWC